MAQDGLEAEVQQQIGMTYNQMGCSLFQQQKFHDSITIFNEVLNFMDQDPGVYINRGDAYRELTKYNLALSDYHYALDLGGDKELINTRLGLTHFALGVICFNKKDYEGAKIEFSRSIDYNDRVPETYVNRARSCIELSQMEAAFLDLDRTIEMAPQHEVANSLLMRFNRAPKRKFQEGRFIN